MATKRIESKIINRFLLELSRSISIDKAILFGSSAKRKRKQWSDIDIAIISKDFNKFTPIERLVFLGKTAWQSHTTEIEALGYTPQEYRSSTKFDFLNEIKKTGKTIYP